MTWTLNFGNTLKNEQGTMNNERAKAMCNCHSHKARSDQKAVKENDIDFSSKASWEHSWKELFTVLGKRVLSFPSKVIGFKPLCLLIATWLLVQGHIRDWIWFSVVVIVLFGIVGLKVISRWKDTE